MMARMPFGAEFCHELVVSNGNLAAVYCCDDSVAGSLLNVLDGAVVLFVGIRVPERHGNGMGGVAFNVGCKMKEFFLIQLFGMDGGHFEDAFCERSGLVKDYGFKL